MDRRTNNGGPKFKKTIIATGYEDIYCFDRLGPLTRQAINDCRFRISAIGVLSHARSRDLDPVNNEWDDLSVAIFIAMADELTPTWTEQDV